MDIRLDGPFRGSAAVAAGLLTWNHLRGPRFRRLFPDVYVPAHLDVDLALRSRAAYLLVAGRAAPAGYSAAELLGRSCNRPGTDRRWGCRPGSVSRSGRGRGWWCTATGCSNSSASGWAM